MPKALFVGMHRRDRSPSQRFRFEQYLPYLEENGWTCELAPLVDEATDRWLYQPGGYLKKARFGLRAFRQRLQELKTLNDYAVVLVQREAFMTGTTRFERAYAQARPAFLYDFDDAIWQPNVSEANRLLGFLKNPRKTEVQIAQADYVLAGNAYLAEYARRFNERVEVFPTTVDTDHHRPLEVPRSRPGVCIGWSGSQTTYDLHFPLIVPVLDRLLKRYGDGIYLKVIGTHTDRFPQLQALSVPWQAATEVEDMAEFDIGIMPLPNDEWSRGKCGLKGLTYMAMGIPTLMAPVGVNPEIITNGQNGYLPATDAEWENRLAALIDSEGLRHQMGEAGRQTVLERYSVVANRARYLAIFNALARGELPETSN